MNRPYGELTMKREEVLNNRLCLSCRRTCKQPAAVVIARCPRYYAGPRIKRDSWKQLPLPF